MNDSLEDLYQEIILEHNKRPRNFGSLPGANSRAKAYNPVCGDEVEVYLLIESGVVQRIGFQGQGCAISRASASLMTQALQGKTVQVARELMHNITALVQNQAVSFEPVGLGELAALSGVRKFPARAKCATLAWHALEQALDQYASSSSAK
jgi:nitrogen fixation protein NifU and related proteins